MKKIIALVFLSIIFLPHCTKERYHSAKQEKTYTLFSQEEIQAKQMQQASDVETLQPIPMKIVEKPTKHKTPELDFEVKNATGKSLYAVCFSYIQKEEFARWRWDKSPVYKLDPNASVFVNVDTIPDYEHREDIFGYLAIFEDEMKAEESIYELVEDNKKIDLDQLYKLKNKTVVIDIEKYGFKKRKLDFAIKERFKKKLPSELDFIIENQTGRTIFATGFIYQVKDNIRSIWSYDKTPVLKLEHGQIGMIDIDTITNKRDRTYMSGFLGIFEGHEEEKARDATYELLPSKNKIALGRLSRITNQRIVIEIERYGAVGEITEFAIKPSKSPIDRMRATKAPPEKNIYQLEDKATTQTQASAKIVPKAAPKNKVYRLFG